VTQQSHVIDRVRAGNHPGDRGRDLQPGVRALIRRHRQPLIGQFLQPGIPGQGHHRQQPGSRSSKETDTEARLWETCIYEMPSFRWPMGSRPAPFFLKRRHSRFKPPSAPRPSSWIKAWSAMTTAPTRVPRSLSGSNRIPGSTCTSPRHTRPGSTRSNGSLPTSPPICCNARTTAVSRRSKQTPANGSRAGTRIRSHSCGPSPQNLESLKRLLQRTTGAGH
jgi:hypothetical protein